MMKRMLARGVAWLALGALCGCGPRSSGTNPSSPRAASAEFVAATSSPLGSASPGINLQCDAEHIRNAPAPFHWSYKKVVPPLANVDWEADITPFSIAGAVTDSSGTRVIHGLRSDSTSWNTVVAILTGALPASTFALVNNSSAIALAGREVVNGQETVKYTIDTSRDVPADASLIRSVLGAHGFIKGAVWANAQGCPIKFVLNVEQDYHDGTVHKEYDQANATQQ